MSIKKAFDLVFAHDKQTQELGFTLIRNNFSNLEIDNYTQKTFGHAMKLSELSWDKVVMLPQLNNASKLSIDFVCELRNLENITLSDKMVSYTTKLSDITKLSALTKLKTLVLSSNQISDISALSMLLNLEYLQIDNNLITDIAPLSNLINLRAIYMYNNSITDIKPLFNLTNLINLYMDSKLITEDDMCLLKKALPNCTIDVD